MNNGAVNTDNNNLSFLGRVTSGRTRVWAGALVLGLGLAACGGSGESTEALAFADSAIDSSGIEWGDDSSIWANDDECDDPRFEGPGTHDILLDSDLMADATDCRTLYEAGQIWLR